MRASALYVPRPPVPMVIARDGFTKEPANGCGPVGNGRCNGRIGTGLPLQGEKKPASRWGCLPTGIKSNNHGLKT